MSESEVARLLCHIDQEFEAAQRGLSGLSQGTSVHAFITSRNERVGNYQKQLALYVGEEKAMHLICEHYVKMSE